MQRRFRENGCSLPMAARKVGRCLLASSHAGTRLPIAVLQGSGRSPSARHGSWTAAASFQNRLKQNRRHPLWMPPVKNLRNDFLRRHYPHQVKGRSWRTSSQPACTSSPVFICRAYYTPVFTQMQAVIPTAFATMRGSPRQCPALRRGSRGCTTGRLHRADGR